MLKQQGRGLLETASFLYQSRLQDFPAFVFPRQQCSSMLEHEQIHGAARVVRPFGASSQLHLLSCQRQAYLTVNCLRVTFVNDTHRVAIHKYPLCLGVAMTQKTNSHRLKAQEVQSLGERTSIRKQECALRVI